MDGTGRKTPVAIAVLFFALLIAWLFWPALSGRGSFVHGDNISLSLPLQSLLARSLEQGVFPLWSDGIYGGHPIFAEGQGAFAHPVNLLLFGLVAPLRAHDLFFPLCSLIAALSTWGLCRKLGASSAASLVGGLAFAGSPSWLGLSGNATIAGAVAWLPATLLALEHWWDHPNAARATLLGAAVALVLLAGYPQIAHAGVIFMAVCVALRCFGAPYRKQPRLLGRHVATGLLAAAIALGLAAVQLLPLLELAGQSIRAEGISLVAEAPADWHYRGLLFTNPLRKAVAWGVGSLLVSFLALASLLGRPDPRLLGYLAGSGLLFLLSTGEHSSLYRALHHLLPGLDSFRTTQLYVVPALAGASVLAAAGVDRLAELRRPGRREIGILAAIAIALAVAGLALAHEAVPWTNYLFVCLAWAGLAILWLVEPEPRDDSAPAASTALGPRPSLRRWAPSLILLVLLVEVASLRAPLLGFADSEILRTPPATVRYIEQRHPGERDFKIANVPHFYAYLGFASGSNPRLDDLLRSNLASLEAAGNLIWDLDSIHANLALPLERRHAVSELLEAEARGRSGRSAGERFMDLLGIRYLVVHSSHLKGGYAPDLVEVFRDEATRFAILENRHALPRLQLRSGAIWVDDAGEAAALLAETGGSTLLLEGPAGWSGETEPGGEGSGSDPPLPSRFDVIARSAERYEVAIELPRPAWLFVADAWYPGWEAQIDGKHAAVYPANALGKAVRVPAGSHEVVLRFRSGSARLGSIVTTATLLALLLGLLWRRVARRARGTAP